MSAPDTSAGAALHCATHPSVETYLRCAQCGKPICLRCLVMTPVGAKCVACARPRRLPTFQISPINVLVGLLTSIGIALALGGVGSLLLRRVPLFVMLFPFLAGMAIGECVSVVVNRKRHLIFRVIVGLGVVVSYLALELGDFLVHAPIELATSGMVIPLLLNVFVGVVENPFIVLFVGVGIWVGIARVG